MDYEETTEEAHMAAMQEALGEYKAAKKPEWKLETGGEYTRCPDCRCWHKLMSRMVGNVREWTCGECCAEWETEE